MATAVHFLATAEDERQLFDHLTAPDGATVHPWPFADVALVPLTAELAFELQQLMVTWSAVGPPVLVAPRTGEPGTLPVSGVLDRFRTTPMRPPAGPVGLVHGDRSPVLVWQRHVSQDALQVCSLGSQARLVDSLGSDYRSWVLRSMDWVSRSGTQVWGHQAGHRRDDLDVDLSIASAVYALPGALMALEDGARAR